MAQFGSIGLKMKIPYFYKISFATVRKGCFMFGGSIGWLSHGVKGF